MKVIILFIAFVFGHSSELKPICHLSYKFANQCYFYSYNTVDCFQWDISKCKISKKTSKELRCPYYICSVILFKRYFNANQVATLIFNVRMAKPLILKTHVAIVRSQNLPKKFISDFLQ